MKQIKLKFFVCFIFLLLSVLTYKASAKTFRVSTSSDLRAAFNSVQPGDSILLNEGTYNSSDGRGHFRISKSGTPTQRISMSSVNGGATLSSGGASYGLYMNASYWTISSNYTYLLKKMKK
jgi:hypothetical protein